MTTKKEVKLNLLKRAKNTAQATIPPAGVRCFTFDDGERHRKGYISGEVYISETYLDEHGEPARITIEF